MAVVKTCDDVREWLLKQIEYKKKDLDLDIDIDQAHARMVAIRKWIDNGETAAGISPEEEFAQKVADIERNVATIEDAKRTISLLGNLLNDSDFWKRSELEPVQLEGMYTSLSIRSYGSFLYQNRGYDVTGRDSARPYDENKLLIMEFVDRERQRFERLKAKFDSGASQEIKRERLQIPEEVRIAVWRRDQGRCARCRSRENLEYDHIVPVSKGGSNTVRNVELLCESCNRQKGNRIQ